MSATGRLVWALGLGGLAALAVITGLSASFLGGSVAGPLGVLLTTLFLGSVFGHYLSSTKQNDVQRLDLGTHLVQRLQSGKRIAIYDPASALYVRWYFELRLTEEIERCRRYKASTAVVVIAMAGDEEGWTSGRKVQLAQLLSHKVRSVDLAASLSNREYVLCLPNTDRQGAVKTVRRLIGELQGFDLTVGMAVCPADGELVDDLLSHAQAGAQTDIASRGFEPPAPARARRRYDDLILAGAQESVRELDLAQDESAKTAKAALRRASRRLGVRLDIWDQNGKIYFKPAPDEAA